MALALALIFRKPIVGLIPLIERIKFPGGEVNLRRQLEETSSQAERSLPSQDPPSIDERIQDIAESYPRGAMIESWLLIERELIDVAEGLDVPISPSQRRSPRQVAQALAKAGILDESLVKIVSDLQSIRNSVVHSISISPSRDDAREFATTATRVVAAIREKRE
ncbi:MAG: hypothetical protein F4X83_09065 [Chloroflexi bacterium]|nr:hypothetical protein [Chloroflexota bacterium]